MEGWGGLRMCAEMAATMHATQTRPALSALACGAHTRVPVRRRRHRVRILSMGGSGGRGRMGATESTVAVSTA